MKFNNGVFLLTLSLLIWVSSGVAQVMGVAGRRDRVYEASEFVRATRVDDATVELRIDLPTAAVDGWRFWIEAPQATSEAEIRDRVSGRLRGTISASALGRGTWSPALARESVAVDVVTTGAAQIRFISWPETVIGTQTLVGTPNLIPVKSAHLSLDMQELTGSVGLLSINYGQVEKGGETFLSYCTVFLVAADYALTAEHCVRGGIEGRAAQLVFGYLDRERFDGLGAYSVVVEAVEPRWDLALLRLEPPAQGGKVFTISEVDPAEGTTLVILQHFQGEPMSVSSDADCRVRGGLYPGPSVDTGERLVSEPGVAFGHGCDTTTSSSGSPVLDRAKLVVVGVHQSGYREGDSVVNRAISAPVIARFLAGRR